MIEAVRPRLLVLLAVLSFLYATLGLVTALASLATLTGSHDAFTSEVRRQADKLVLKPEAGKPVPGDELSTVATRKAEALWTRRGQVLPLAGASLIACMLVTLGVTRIWGPAMARRAWGRSAWQLGCLVSLPIIAMQTLVELAHTRDLAAAIADLSGPFATSLKDVQLASAVVWLRSSVAATFALGVAAYLNGRPVRAYTGES